MRVLRSVAFAAPVVLAIGAAMLGASGAFVQGVVGHVYDFHTGVAVTTADVLMTSAAGDTVGRAVSDLEGGFVILVDELGEYALVVSRLGYVTDVSAQISIDEATLQGVELLIRPDAVGIEGIVVSSSPRVDWLRRNGFYERARSRAGDFIQPTKTEKLQAFSTTGLLRKVPGLRLTRGRVGTLRGGSGLNVGPCGLKVFVNGIDVGFDLDAAVIRYDVSAIEVYKSVHHVPAQYLGTASSGTRGAQSCGAVLVWTEVGGR